jgi:DNA (cytosine-5)-methyltransferase 1
VELFAGVGGFRLGLEKSGWRTVWANQWEPSTKTQHAFDCYVERFGPEGANNRDIHAFLDDADDGRCEPIPDHDLLVGGFPCQDYSVAKTLSQAAGIEGKKGVLWWDIYRILVTKLESGAPVRSVILENVDRLLKSPASQRGRDFAIILACLSDLGYLVEWRVVNAADYGFPQRRRRVFVVAHHLGGDAEPRWDGAMAWMSSAGALARALPVKRPTADVVDLLDPERPDFVLEGHPAQVSQEFGGAAVSPFRIAGVMWQRKVWTQKLEPAFRGRHRTLADIVVPDSDVQEHFFIPASQVDQWRYLKGPKKVERVARNGHAYIYSEGGIAFPDPLDKPSRTILTGEGGSTPSRFKHLIETEDGKGFRRLVPVELERLNGFPDGWTDTGMPDGRRAFMMGNALVVGVVERIGKALAAMPRPVGVPTVVDLQEAEAPALSLVK